MLNLNQQPNSVVIIINKIINKDGNKITLGLNDRDSIEQVNGWPDKVMLLISHKWKCFGKTTTQFFYGEGIKKKQKEMSRISVPVPSIDNSNKINLNALFDNTTGKSSKPNFPLGISLKIAGSFFSSLKLTDASISLNGNALLNLDLSINGTVGNSTFDAELLSLPLLGSFGIPDFTRFQC
ncbi:hypothetical protein C1645_825945 [Glomus cerebriforme]|uniref:Uncharacterized protein n=1 Tax=Glomus cerebriforme TaxID=658196 RepID=A0A397T0Y9_9GLOM|nr:hypothetical protein C1645_825945 [Glomus cerebriforme]